MNKPNLLAALLLTSLGAAAQSSDANLNRVDVTGTSLRPPVRYDVSHACPALARSLSDDLGWFADHSSLPREMRVAFEVDTTGNVLMKSTTAPRDDVEFRRALRRAVQSVDCERAAVGRQAYAFQLVFFDDSERRSGGNRVALAEPKY